MRFIRFLLSKMRHRTYGVMGCLCTDGGRCLSEDAIVACLVGWVHQDPTGGVVAFLSSLMARSAGNDPLMGGMLIFFPLSSIPNGAMQYAQHWSFHGSVFPLWNR